MNDDDIDYENMFDMDTFIWTVEVHEDANEDPLIVDMDYDDDAYWSVYRGLFEEGTN